MAPATYICSIKGIAAGVSQLPDDHAFGPRSLRFFLPRIHSKKSNTELQKHSPPLDYRYSWIVESPETCPTWNQQTRCELEEYGGRRELDGMLLGADWIQSMNKIVIAGDHVYVEPDPRNESDMRQMWNMRRLADYKKN